MKEDLREVFNRFAGMEVDSRLGMNDPVLKSMDRVARGNGLELRVWFPGMSHINDHNPNRVNVYLGTTRRYKARIERLSFGTY